MRFTYPSFLKFSVFGLILALISGCSFHLRGDYDVPDQLSTLSITSYDKYSTLTRLVKTQLRMNEINLVSPGSQIPNLHLKSESISERTLSVYQNTREAEEELTLAVSYEITIPDMGVRTFSTSVSRSYLDNPLAALAKSMEKTMIADEMRKIVAQQIIRQMAQLKADFEHPERFKETTAVDDAS